MAAIRQRIQTLEERLKEEAPGAWWFHVEDKMFCDSDEEELDLLLARCKQNNVPTSTQ